MLGKRGNRIRIGCDAGGKVGLTDTQRMSMIGRDQHVRMIGKQNRDRVIAFNKRQRLANRVGRPRP